MTLLVRRAQDGDAESFVALMEENKMAMRRIAAGFFRDEEDVADAMQETVLDAWEHLGKLRQEKYFKTWLVKILINNCNKIYNRNKRTVALEECPEPGATAADADAEFRELLSVLPEDSRLIFQLYYGEEFTTREISRILRMKENTVKSRLHRGKEELRGFLRTDGDGRKHAEKSGGER